MLQFLIVFLCFVFKSSANDINGRDIVELTVVVTLGTIVL